MAAYKTALLVSLFVCFSYVKSEVEDLQPLLTSSQESVQKAKTHVEHMLNLSPLPNEDKLHPVVKNETEHLAYEMRKLATKLHDVVAEGEHKPEVKEAVNQAVTHLNEAAETLKHEGTDLKEANAKYYAAAEKQLHELKAVHAAGPCGKVNAVLKKALGELKHDVHNYEHEFHDTVGPHEGGPEHQEHTEEGHHHHQHHGTSSSSEESKEGHNSHSHEHHDHHSH